MTTVDRGFFRGARLIENDVAPGEIEQKKEVIESFIQVSLVKVRSYPKNTPSFAEFLRRQYLILLAVRLASRCDWWGRYLRSRLGFGSESPTSCSPRIYLLNSVQLGIATDRHIIHQQPVENHIWTT